MPTADSDRPDPQFLTFAGGGFGTVQVQRVEGDRPTPPAVSAREYLRSSLPAIYQESDFALRFVEALEQVLDPVVALLDNLAAHFDARHAPRDVLELLTAWLGLEHDESRSGEQRRQLVLSASELMTRRGTVAGIEMALRLNFPDVPLRVEDGGGIHWSAESEAQPAAGPPSFVVFCDKPIPENQQSAIARVIERARPAHVSFRLRVKAARPRQEPDRT